VSTHRAILAATVVLAGAILPGCRGSGGADGPTPRPAPAAADLGLEARIWVVDATGAPLMRALAPHALADSRLPAETAARWRESGFRLVDLPADEADRIERALPHADAVRRLALGQPTAWARLASAPVSRSAAVVSAAGLRAERSGRYELLTRAWPEPEVRGDRAFRVEVTLAWRPDTGGDPEVVDRLLVSLTVPAGRALAIVPAGPDEPWITAEPAGPRPGDPGTPGPAGPDTEAPKSEGVAPLPPPRTETPTPVATGPVDAPARTLGEAMLISPPELGALPRPARREVFVLVPRWP